ncbi:MAG: hypothetical protein DRJ61_06165 [Acidobacteria bacterium]|nr:MAG: hypothetical protein DRJ65_08845 [Acidobacteriota bacterium]RLE33941.1 MAG: hypothetical protein DRJ61_06165 [Acidobacteriota bacterium]
MKRLIPALSLTLIIIGGAAASLAASEAATCCFTNTRFSGQCTVTLGAEETCADILSYLNNQNSVGKAYCGNTIIRGGWASVTCEEKKAGRLGSRDAGKPGCQDARTQNRSAGIETAR